MIFFFYQLGLVLDWGPGVTVGVQEHLGVGMDGEESLEVTVGLHKVHNGLDLRLGISTGSMVGLGAGAAAGTSSCTTNDNRVKKKKTAIKRILLSV